MKAASEAAASPGAAPGPAEPDETFRFASRDGTGLYGELFAAAGERIRGAALILHGYAEHGGRYREVAHVLCRLGFTVLAFDMRGHGRSDGQRGHIDRFTDYLDDADAARAELEARAGASAPLLLVAHSNGALVALRMLADPTRLPARVRAAVLSSPFLALKMKVPLTRDIAGRIAGRFLPSFSLPNEIPIDALTSDPAKLAERRLDTLCHDVAGARWYLEALETQAWVRAYASRIRLPTLWLVAGADRLVDPAAARAVHRRIRAESSYHELRDMHHEVFNEVDRDRVFDVVRSFVEENFSTE
jgi:alpha-beta hydrolase superfamily lysophospholipase